MQESVSSSWLDLSHWNIVDISGPDAEDFLQRLSTAGIKQASPDQVLPAAFLTGRGSPIGIGWLLRTASDRFLFVGPPPQGSRVAEHLERFHFAEKLEIRDACPELTALGVLDSSQRIAAALGVEGGTPLHRLTAHAGEMAGPFFFDEVISGLGIWILPRTKAPGAIEALTRAGAHPEPAGSLEYLRLLNRRALPGQEIAEGQIVLEADWDIAIHPAKGCYPGQEVVERIRTYGQTQRKLFRFRLEGWPADRRLQAGLPLLSKGEAVGELVATAPSPKAGQPTIGLGFLSKRAWDLKAFELESEEGVKAIVW